MGDKEPRLQVMIVKEAMTEGVEQRRQAVLTMVESLDVLPTTTSIPVRLLELQRSRSASASQFAQVLAADPCLCTKVLGFANSAWFSPTRPITKVSEAISMIGLRHLSPLVLASAIAGIYDKVGLPAETRRRFWESFLLKGVAARECACHCVPDRAEEAFVCGLLQDLVLPVFYAADLQAWPEVDAVLDAGNDVRREREISVYGTDHTEMGRRLTERLGLPELYRGATKAHHDGPDLRRVVEDDGLARCLEFAALLPHRAGKRDGVSRDVVAFFQREDNVDALDIPPAKMLANTEKQYSMTLEVLGQDSSADAGLKECLQEATHALTLGLEAMIGESNMLLSTFKTVESNLKQEIQKLEWRATQSDYDSLTGILNRRGFLARTNEVFARAAELEFECALGFVDLDGFKTVNDRYGHSLGDLVLRAVAESLRDAIRGSGWMGRFGGDEFAFLIVASDRSEATEIADRLAGALSNLTVTADDLAVSVTASVGLTWIGTPNRQLSVESVLEQADRFMYEAKRSGGGRYVTGEYRPKRKTERGLA